MDDILLVKGAAMEASPSFTIAGCSSTSVSISFRTFSSFEREFTGVPLGLFLVPLFGGAAMVSYLESSRLSGGLERIATPNQRKDETRARIASAERLVSSSSSTYPLGYASKRRRRSFRRRTSTLCSPETAATR